ncbi:hypothetical protein KU854_00045 [Enterovibrio sp. NIFS-20-8]|nr:hypothetical protein [Enterovibrio paralichthyis]
MCNHIKNLFFTALLAISTSPLANDETALGIATYNKGEFQEARSLFLAQSEKGDAYATFWLGVTQWETGERFQAGDTFLRAAEMGDPWAMYMLVPRDGNPCRYLGWPCDKAWKAKALEGWEVLAEQGSAKAQFAITKVSQPWWEYIPFYRLFRYHDLLETGMEQNTYGAYYRYIGKFGKFSQYEFDYMLRSAKKGYAPLMSGIGNSEYPSIKGQELSWLLKSLEEGLPSAAMALCSANWFGRENVPINLEAAFYYSVIHEALSKGSDKCDVPTFEYLKDEYGGFIENESGDDWISRDLISKERQEELRKEAEAYAETLTPNLFLDETTIELFVY